MTENRIEEMADTKVLLVGLDTGADQDFEHSMEDRRADAIPNAESGTGTEAAGYGQNQSDPGYFRAPRQDKGGKTAGGDGKAAVYSAKAGGNA